MATQNDIVMLEQALTSGTRVSFDYPLHGTGPRTFHTGTPTDFRDANGSKYKTFSPKCTQIWIYTSRPQQFKLELLTGVR